MLLWNIGEWSFFLFLTVALLYALMDKTLQCLFTMFVRSDFDGAYWHIFLLLDIEGKCSNLWGRTVVLFAPTFYFLGYWHLVKQIPATALKTRRWFSPLSSRHIFSLDSEVNCKTSLIKLVGLDCLYFRMVDTPLVVLLLHLLYYFCLTSLCFTLLL